MFGYLKTTWSDILYMVHKCACFSQCPKQEHGKVIQWLGRHLKGTWDKETTFKPNKDLGLKVYVDANLAGNWNRKEAATDCDTAQS
jgi:hypothetical protein